METGELNDAYGIVVGRVEEWITTFFELLPNMVVAIFVLILFYVLGRIARRAVSNLFSKVTDNKTITSLLETIIGISIVGIGVFIALSVLQLDGAVTSLLAGAGIIGLALGFAFQDIASNFISGVILSIRHPFGIGDIIQTNDFYGTVQKLNLRNTIMKTVTGQIVYLPNKKVFENPLENFTSTGLRRIDLSCGVSYGDDLEKAKQVAVEAIDKVDSVLSDKGIEFYYDEFGDSSINFKLRFWVTFVTNPDFWSVRSEAIIALTKAFDENDIMIPFPIRTLDFGIRGGEKLNTMISTSKDGNPSGGTTSEDRG
ncbi:mechanosensitive ion channel family protein [Rhodohalobacter sp. SW132]|uniref:mechanosensitive ion channel family protein n=1 Tax=Rhodohalobacter sp. SW132 TaxID=2293433 RepID=UPI000E25D264|nr:mechanosensitive ion channel family protein [Rhodohalobacter sp. SW132]REL33689.1 mechanosensitive ion channel family protein [Rhodohalobacter sp. SW132]